MAFGLLFIIPFLAGLLGIRLLDSKSNTYFRLALIFTGSYLFSITVLHVLPEIYKAEEMMLHSIGLFVLIGFFLQHVLEYLSGGIEHGHLHVQDHSHHHNKSFVVSLMIGLGIHSFLEGLMLSYPSIEHGHQHDAHTLLWGIILHKIPAAFALMTALVCAFKRKIYPYALLVLFCMASPIGMFVGELLIHKKYVSTPFLNHIMALVAGSFLYISTTIFFESSPHNHRMNLQKLGVSLLAALIAVASEFLLN